MEASMPTPPPHEDHGKSRKTLHSSSKPAKPMHRASKRASPHSHPSPSHHHDSHPLADGRHKRVWKACERCRMKKTKCDGEFPCKRCKDDGLVCTAGTRKKTEYKQLPKGYAEVLENTQFALIATVHKLYSMVRNSQPWDLGEPDLNDRGQPVIHNIASKLGCIRPNNDLDLPVQSIFPEDEAGLAELAAQLEAQQKEREALAVAAGASTGSSMDMAESESSYQQLRRTDRASSSELDQSDFEQPDYRRSVFGGNSALTLSPQSLSYNDFDAGSTQSSSDGFTVPSPATSTLPTSYPAWMSPAASGGSRPTSMDLSGAQFIHQPAGAFLDMDLLNQGLLESNFGTIKPHMLSCPNPEVMMGMGDPMIYQGYDADALRL